MSENEREKGRPWGTSEIARKAGVTATYVRQLLIEGKLPGYKLGNSWAVEDEVARAWLAKRRARWH